MKISEIDFRSLDIKEIGLWPTILRVGVIVAVGIITLVVAYIFILKEQIDLLSMQKQQEVTKRKEFQDKYNLAANLVAYEKQMIEIKDSYKKTLRELPLSDLLPELIDNISQIAQSNGVKPKAIKPGKDVAILGFYKEMPISLSLEGFYNGFGGFVSDISNLSRVVTLHDFTIKRISSTKDNTGHGLLILEINAKTYWLSTEKPEENVDDKKSSNSKTKGAPKKTTATSKPGGASGEIEDTPGPSNQPARPRGPPTMTGDSNPAIVEEP